MATGKDFPVLCPSAAAKLGEFQALASKQDSLDFGYEELRLRRQMRRDPIKSPDFALFQQAVNGAFASVVWRCPA